jgi:predicted Zn-dependent peptidase
VEATMAAYDETGSFSLELSTAPENLPQAVGEVLAELTRLVQEEVPYPEFQRVRQSYFYDLEYSRDSSYEMQVRYGWGELMDLVRTIEDDTAEAMALTPLHLQTVARDIFRPTNLNLVVVGAWQEEHKQSTLAEIDRYAHSW